MKSSLLRIVFAFASVFAILPANIYGQYHPHARNMKEVIDDLDKKEFIPNNGQYNLLERVHGEVKYAVENPKGEFVLFTANSIQFTFPKYELAEEEESKVTPVEGEEHEQFVKTYQYVTFTWQNSDPSVVLEAKLPESYIHYYRNPAGPKSLSAVGFKELTYKNLYPGIDVEFTFHEVRGLKYQYIVHPGADIAAIRVLIEGGNRTRLEDGMIEVETDEGTIMDAAPFVYYSDSRTELASSYLLSDKVVTFNIEKYDHSREVIIDPWLVSPGFNNNNKAYDVCVNPTNGDIFVYGGTPDYQANKYDALGNLMWTYVTTIIGTPGSNYYGDLVADDEGQVYIANGCCSASVIKIEGDDTDLLWDVSQFSEPWRLAYDFVNDRLVAAGYFGIDYIATVNPDNGNTIDSQTLIGVGFLEEIRSLGFTEDNEIMCLHVSPWLAGDPTTNYLTRTSDDLNNFYYVASGYSLEEGGSYYAESESGGFCADPDCFHGFNGVANTGDLIFTWNGVTLIKRAIVDGTQLGSIDVPGGVIDTNSGVVADSCGYIYVGVQSEIRKYDYDLNFIEAVDVTGPVYDLYLSSNADVIACGDGWVLTMLSGCSGFHIQTQVTPPLCTGDCNASIVALGLGGEEPYTYIWNPGNITDPEITDICAGLYTVTVIDNAGDTLYADVNVADPLPLDITFNIVPSACGTTNGSATAIVSGGTPGYDYLWSPGGATSAGISGLAPGDYTLTVTDNNGCELDEIADVPQGPPPSVEFVFEEPECFGECNGSISTVVNDGTAPYTYFWSTQQTTPSIDDLCPGLYAVQVTDNFGCTGSDELDLPAAPQMFINADFVRCKNDGSDGMLTVTASGGHPGYSYEWLVEPPVEGQVLDSIPAGVYLLLVEDANNCLDTFEVVLPACPHDSLFIPNIFTPNNDADNDFFVVYNTGFDELRCQIFNRWGNLVYEWEDTAGYWDGEINGKQADDGVYYYIVEGTYYSGESISRSGYFHLVGQKE